ncbi:MAG: GDSL family lipase [Ruminococcaceae bacterium]|nr:GDSL family lipase [Oscillospiraceae bacterium]
MRIVEKIVKKQNDNHNPGVTVAFLGDSVTQGCFEVYKKTENSIETVFDKSFAYHKYFAEIFEFLCPKVPVNIINAGVSGASAPFGLENIDEFVLKHNPDLTVVCFGLNDATRGAENLKNYTDALSEIFDKLASNNSEIIFMTPNMACTEISPHITDAVIKSCAEKCANVQRGGILDLYIESAIKLCKEKNVVVCDCYKKWKTLYNAGINTTELLSNKINHPTREMNRMFAYSLVETIFNN